MAVAGLFAFWFGGAARVEPSLLGPVLKPLSAASAPTSLDRVAVALPNPPSTPASQPEGTVEVCGFGWIKRPEDAAEAQALMSRLDLEPAQKRILAKLRADPDEFARATALLVELTSGEDAGWLARIGLVADARADALDRLARLAASSSDARVYAIAYKACSGSADAGACQLISAEQWARLDPDNAAPWLFMLSTATDRKDAAAQAEALHRIASARYERLGFFAAAGTILDAAPSDDATQLATADLLTRVIGFEAAVGLPGLGPLVGTCKGAALADANRAQTCGGIAEVMTERSDTLIDRMIGTSIGRNIGWPAERQERLRGEYSAYLAAMMSEGQDFDSYGCARLRRETTRLRRHVAVGEVGAMREWIARSGKTSNDFLREERARKTTSEQATEQRAAASAASASAAANANPDR